MKATIHLSADSAYFAGHFPGRPILPGVVTLQLGAKLLARHGYPVRGVRLARLRQPVGPGDRLAIAAQPLDGVRAKLALMRGDALVANGELVLGAPGASAHLPAAERSEWSIASGDRPTLDALLPHRAPMRFVTAVSREADDGLACLASIPGACALVSDGDAPPIAAIEAAAQAAALWEALRRWRGGGAAQARVGYLVALRDVIFHAEHIAADTPFLVCVQLQDAAAPLTHYRIEARNRHGLIASGVIATYLTSEPAAGS